MSKINLLDFQANGAVDLSAIPTKANLSLSNKKLTHKLSKKRIKLAEFQNRMYAHNKYSVLICIQGMDTSGKDSLIREVFKDLNARGVVVHSFKAPSKTELAHDYLWRHYLALPERGQFSIFNRSHYENVLITRVHPEYILAENNPHITSLEAITPAFWEQRFQEIINFEQHLSNHGTIVMKFFLHISKEEQRRRLLRRLAKKDKHWKFSRDDIRERALWNDYQRCYEDAIMHTSTPSAPWYIIPSDSKKESRLILASILHEKFKSYQDIQAPVFDEHTEAFVEKHKQMLLNEHKKVRPNA